MFLLQETQLPVIQLAFMKRNPSDRIKGFFVCFHKMCIAVAKDSVKKKRLEKEHKSIIPDSLGLSLCDPCVKTCNFSSPNCTLLFLGYCIFNVLKKACAL